MKKSKDRKFSNEKISEFSTISLIVFWLDVLSLKIYQAIGNGFFGKLFSSYSQKQDAFDQGFLKNHFQSGTKLKFYFRKIKEYLSKSFEGSLFVQQMGKQSGGFLSLPLKSCGSFLFFFGFYTVLIYLFKWLLPDLIPADISYAIVGALCCILAIPMRLSRDNIAESIVKGRMTHSIFIDGLGFREEAFDIPTKHSRAKSNIVLLLGMLLGILTFFVNPLHILLATAFLIGISLILSNPEIGVIFALFLAPFLSIFSSPAIVLGMLILITSFSYAVKLIRGKRILKIELIDFTVILFLLALYFSGAISAGGQQGYREVLLSCVLMFGYFLVVNLMRTEKWLHRCIFALVSSGTIVSVIGILQYVLGLVTAGSWLDVNYFSNIKGRVISVFENPNILASYLLLILPFSLFLWTQAQWKKTKFVSFFSVASILLCIVFTWSRGAWLAALVCVMVFALIYSRKTLRSLFLLGFAIPFLPFLLPESVIGRFMSIGNLSDSSTSYRLYTWKGSLQVIKDYFWSGIGYGNTAYREIYPQYAYAGIEAAQHSHSLFLQILLGMGIGGLLIFLTIIVLSAQMGFEYIKTAKDQSSRMIVASVISAIIASLIMGIFDFVWYNYRVFFLFWIVLALGCACIRIGMDEQRRHEWNTDTGSDHASLDLNL